MARGRVVLADSFSVQMRALIVYHDHNIDWLWRRVLRYGFKHCLVFLDDGEYWVGFDNSDGAPLVQVYADNDFELADHFRATPGYTVQEIALERRRALPGGLGLNNCVTAIKRLLCIRAWWVQTPYRLYCHLERVHASDPPQPQGP